MTNRLTNHPIYDSDVMFVRTLKTNKGIELDEYENGPGDSPQGRLYVIRSKRPLFLDRPMNGYRPDWWIGFDGYCYMDEDIARFGLNTHIPMTKDEEDDAIARREIGRAHV